MPPITHNDQIWRVAISFLKSTNVVKLPNPHNSIHNALRSESQNLLRAKGCRKHCHIPAADSRSSCSEISQKAHRHMPDQRLLGSCYFSSLKYPITLFFVGVEIDISRVRLSPEFSRDIDLFE